MNIVITSGNGFVGQAIADLYIKAGHHVFVTGHEATVAIMSRVCGKLDPAEEAARRRRQEEIARRLDAEPICWAEKVVRWVAETGQSGATLWRVLKRCREAGAI